MSNGARDRAAPSNRRSRSSNAAPANLDPPPRLSIPEEPPKVPRRPPSKGNKRETLADIAKRIPVQLMRQYFNYPLRSAAEAMHISVTTLKRLCRRHGVKRWPHRQISGINRALNDLENQHQAAGDGDNGAVADQLRQLHRRREVIIELAFESDEEASRKGFADAPPPAAHKRGHRATASSDSSSSASSSIASITATPSPRPRSDSLVEAPESPVSTTSVGDNSKPTAAWWQPAAAASGSDDSSLQGGLCKTSNSNGSSSPRARVSSATKAKVALVGEVDAAVGVDAGAAVGVGAGAAAAGGGGVRAGAGVRRPRRSSGTATGSTAASGSSRSGSSKTARTQRSSAMFGNIPRPGKARTTAHQRRKSGNDIAPVVTGAVRRYSVSAPSTSPSAFAGGVSSPGPSRMSVSGGGGGGGGIAIPGCHQLPASATTGVAAAAAAAAAERPVCGSSMFDQGVKGNQQMDDLAALGDLLFGPDETAAAAAAEAKGNGFLAVYPEIFAPTSSPHQWSHGVPFCPPGVFSHDQSLLGAPSSFASHDHGFLTGMAFSSWGGLGSDRNGLGAPHSSVGPL